MLADWSTFATRYGTPAAAKQHSWPTKKGQDAVLRNFSVIGEAANRLSAEIRQAHPEVAWNGAISLRHVVVHDFFKLDLSRIWEVVQWDLPQLDRQVEALLSARPG